MVTFTYVEKNKTFTTAPVNLNVFLQQGKAYTCAVSDADKYCQAPPTTLLVPFSTLGVAKVIVFEEKE